MVACHASVMSRLRRNPVLDWEGSLHGGEYVPAKEHSVWSAHTKGPELRASRVVSQADLNGSSLITNSSVSRFQVTDYGGAGQREMTSGSRTLSDWDASVDCGSTKREHARARPLSYTSLSSSTNQ